MLNKYLSYLQESKNKKSFWNIFKSKPSQKTKIRFLNKYDVTVKFAGDESYGPKKEPYEVPDNIWKTIVKKMEKSYPAIIKLMIKNHYKLYDKNWRKDDPKLSPKQFGEKFVPHYIGFTYNQYKNNKLIYTFLLHSPEPHDLFSGHDFEIHFDKNFKPIETSMTG